MGKKSSILNLQLFWSGSPFSFAVRQLFHTTIFIYLTLKSHNVLPLYTSHELKGPVQAKKLSKNNKRSNLQNPLHYKIVFEKSSFDLKNIFLLNTLPPIALQYKKKIKPQLKKAIRGLEIDEKRKTVKINGYSSLSLAYDLPMNENCFN